MPSEGSSRIPEVAEQLDRLPIEFNSFGVDRFGISRRPLLRWYSALAPIYRRGLVVTVFGSEHVPTRTRGSGRRQPLGGRLVVRWRPRSRSFRCGASLHINRDGPSRLLLARRRARPRAIGHRLLTTRSVAVNTKQPSSSSDPGATSSGSSAHRSWAAYAAIDVELLLGLRDRLQIQGRLF